MLLQILPLGNDRTIVEVHGTCSVFPKRSWLVPISLVLPREVPIMATIRLGVKGPLESGQVGLQWGADSISLRAALRVAVAASCHALYAALSDRSQLE